MAKFLDLCCPDMRVDAITDIDLDDLKTRGIDTLMLDLDNTLLPWRSSVLPDSSRRWIERARNLGMKLCIVSNTHNPRRLQNIADDIGVACPDRALKPRTCGFQKAMKMMNCLPHTAAVVGDQVLTDILGGNRSGMMTILVRPMHPYEFIGTKVSRVVEKVILALLSARRRPGTNRGPNQSEGQDSR